MGLIDRILTLVFGGERNVVRDTLEVFRENAENDASRASALREQAMGQFGAEFTSSRTSGFDRLMDAINRVPRPALALGTLALFVAAMVDPIWFAARMQGIALVPEPLWWLLGVIVSFYFGARHQSKAQGFQREIAQSLSHTSQVVANLGALRRLEARGVGQAELDPVGLDSLAMDANDGNPALEDWKALRTQ